MSIPPVPGSDLSPPDDATSLASRMALAMSLWLNRRSGAIDPAIDEYTHLISETCEPEILESNLVRLAHQVAGPSARRVELFNDRAAGSRSRVAGWPRESESEAADADPTNSVVSIPLRCGGRNRGVLRVELEGHRTLGSDRLRMLRAMAVLAAAADPRPFESAEDCPHPTHDAATGLPNASFFDSFLSYALAQAERRRESLSLLYIGVDRLGAIRDLFGPSLAGEALRKIGRMISGTLRTSDLIARLDDGRLAAVLPSADGVNASQVAESLRIAIVEGGGATRSMPVLTASIGVATYPSCASDASSLRSAAAAALADARSQGRNRVASAPRTHKVEPPPVRLMAHCAS